MVSYRSFTDTIHFLGHLSLAHCRRIFFQMIRVFHNFLLFTQAVRLQSAIKINIEVPVPQFPLQDYTDRVQKIHSAESKSLVRDSPSTNRLAPKPIKTWQKQVNTAELNALSTKIIKF